MPLNRFRQWIAVVASVAALLLYVALPGAASAQSSATPVVTGYLTTSGCMSGQTSCFMQYGASGGGGSYNGPIAAQFPASLGIKTSANSLSIVPASDSTFQVQGNVADGSADAGNPIMDGCLVKSLSTVLVDGNRAKLQCGQYGLLQVELRSGANGGLAVWTNNSAALGTSSSGLLGVRSFGSLWNGTQWVLQPGDTTGTYVVSTPSAASANGIAPSTTATSTNTLKTSAGNAFSVSVTNGTTAGCLILYDSATAPTSGTALTTASIKFHALVAASASYNQDFMWPKAFTSGIQLLFSTTCTTYTTPGTLPVLLTGEAK